MTKTFIAGDMQVVAICNNLTTLLIVVTNGIESYEMLLEYPSEHFRDIAYKELNDELCATLANGVSKLFLVKDVLSVK